MSNTPGSRRDALRAQQLAAQKAGRARRMVALGAGIVALVLIAVLVAVNVNQTGGSGGVTPPNAAPNARGVTDGNNPGSAKDGIAIAPDKAQANAPDVMLFADYQCPGCKALDDAFGAKLNELARSGAIKYSVQIETFLDRFGANKSTDPAIAAACADVVGAFAEYHLAVFEGQPATEGDGFTNDQQRNRFAQSAGITGERLIQFQGCFDSRATAGFVAQEDKLNSAYTSKHALDFRAAGNAAEASAWGRTPLLLVNGKRLDTSTRDPSNPDSITAAIKVLAG